MGINDGGHRVCGVVEAVDELETQRDQQRQPQHREHAQRQRLMRVLDVIDEAMHAIAEAGRKQRAKDDHRHRAGLLVQLWPRFSGISVCRCRDVRHVSPADENPLELNEMAATDL